MISEPQEDPYTSHQSFLWRLLQKIGTTRDWRIGSQLLVFIVPLILGVTVIAAWIVYAKGEANLQEKLTQRARSLHTQIMADREYYAAVIVPRIAELGGSLGPDYRRVHGRFPLPATFVREVSELTAVAKEGYTANLISPWAINPGKGLKDHFQQDAFAYLKDHPTGQFFRTDTVSGLAVMRVLMADRASAQSCVDCHNAHPQSPKHDFKLNDLMGGLEIVIPMEQYVHESRRDIFLTVTGGVVLSLLILGIVAGGTKKVITNPLTELATEIQAVADKEVVPIPQGMPARPGNEVIYLKEAFRRKQAVIEMQQRTLQDANVRLAQRVVERTEALQSLEKRFQLTIEHANDAIFCLDLNGTVLWTNHQAEVVCGRSMSELVGGPFMAFLSRDGVTLAETRLAALRRGESVSPLVEFEVIRPDGSSAWLEINSTSVMDSGQVVGRLLVGRDLTERRQLEAQFRQAQKMEAVGRLAGGIAHDFNNLLLIISGYSEILLSHLKKDDPVCRQIEEIKKAGERAASLTHQLLAFSRKQVLEPKLLNLNVVVANLNSMLQRVIGEDIHLVTVLDPALGEVKADPGQLEQVIINLAVNARDAMPEGGQLTIETANSDLDAPYLRQHFGGPPGSYVMLAVSDTGCGMDAETQSHLFEPFFTTKEQGKGTGLGLSTVYGIVKQSGGYIWVYSELGRGTTFKIFFPKFVAAAQAVEMGTVPGRAPRGTETVLVVEDEPGVRALMGNVLREQGYTILEAQHGLEGLILGTQQSGPIHLLLTDVVMPRMSGREVAERLGPIHPEMKVLYISGYTDDTVVRHGVLDAGLFYLQKPFTPDTLVRKVRAVLDAPTKERKV